MKLIEIACCAAVLAGAVGLITLATGSSSHLQSPNAACALHHGVRSLDNEHAAVVCQDGTWIVRREVRDK